FNVCPISSCNKSVEPAVFIQKEHESSQSSGTSDLVNLLGKSNLGFDSPRNPPDDSMDVDTSREDPSNPTLSKKRLIKELSSKNPVKTITQTESASEISTNSINFLDLYIKIVNAENQNKKMNQEVIRSYYNFGKAHRNRINYYKTLHLKQTAKMFVNDEVRNQLSQKVTETTLRKNTEKAQKIYKLFNSIGGNDNMIEQLIQR
ncbi:636_t:CDS:2, partial [Cetraspora pellucida]